MSDGFTVSSSVTKWLKDLGLERYADIFAENDVDMRVLPDLSEQDLKELGVSLGHRRLIQKAISALDIPTSANSTSSEKEPSADPTIPTKVSPESRAGAERRQLTVMFCDLVGSTKLSEKLDPEELRDLNRTYQDACKAAIERYGGYIARYMGDGVLAYFGYPQAHEDDAERAIHAGLAVVGAMVDLNEPTGNEDSDGLSVRVGIATGAVVVGDLIGQGASQESAVVGGTPNLAARLQGLALPGTVVVSPGTHELALGEFEYDDLGDHELKGFSQPVNPWQVVAPITVESRFEARHRTGLAPMVGREHDIGLLLDRWKQATEREGQVVLLSGEAGIGKSRVTEALREGIATEAHVLLRYQCSPYHPNSALRPIIEQLERAAEFDAEDSNEIKIEKIESLLARGTTDVQVAAPLLAHLLSISAEDRYEPLKMTSEQQKEATLEVLVAQIEGQSRRHPLLLIFEDAHLADPTSLYLLELIVERARSLSVLVVITFRPEFSPPWTGHTHITSLTLNRFTRAQVTSIVERLTGGKSLPDDILEHIVEKTDGVPLFVEELTKTILESDLLEEKSDRYELSGSLSNVAIPSTLHDSLMARLDRLGNKEVAQFAAALGREFFLELLAAASALETSELKGHLLKLLDAELVFRRGTPPSTSYIFKHALVRDAAYESLLHSKRIEIHARIADAIESHLPALGKSQPELLAYHWSRARKHWEATHYWLTAGHRAIEQSANVEAESHLRQGLEALLEVEPSRERDMRELDLQIALGTPLMALKGYGSEEVSIVYRRALQLCESLGDTEHQIPVRYGLWANLFSRMELDASLQVSEEIIDRAEAYHDNVSRMLGLRLHAFGLLHMGQVDKALGYADTAIGLYDLDRHSKLAYKYSQDPKVATLMVHTWAYWHLGQPDQSLESARLSARYAEDLEHPHSIAYAYAWCLTRAHILRREPDEALEASSRCIDVATEYGFPLHRAQALIGRAAAWAMKDNPQEALVAVDAAFRDYDATGAQLQRVWFMALVAEIYLRADRLDDAESALADAQTSADENHAFWWLPELWRLRGTLAIRRDSSNRVEAEQYYRRAHEVALEQNGRMPALRAATCWATLIRDRGDDEAANRLLAGALAEIHEGEELPDLKEAKALMADLI